MNPRTDREIDDLLISSICLFYQQKNDKESIMKQVEYFSTLDIAKKLKEEISAFINIKRKSSNKSVLSSVEVEENSYEQLLIKLEQEIRMHIKTEFQMKIYCENLESKIESMEKDYEKLKKKLDESKKNDENTTLILNKLSGQEEVIFLLKIEIEKIRTSDF